MAQTGRDSNYLPALDGLRFLAFLLVFCHHQILFSYLPGLHVLYTHGWIGVDLFFVLSAYLLTHLLCVEFRQTNGIDIRKFYLRRILRIWPLYFAFILFSLTVYAFVHKDFPSDVLSRIAGLFTLSDNLFAASRGYNPLPFAGHLWTIAYEEQFYLFIPFAVIWIMRRPQWRGVGLLIFVLLLFNIIRWWFITADVQHPAIWVLPVTHFESIVVGVALGTGGMDLLMKKIRPTAALVVAFIFFAIIYALPPIDEISYHLPITYTCIGLCTASLLVAVMKSVRLSRMFSTRVLVFLGKRSYGLYIFHLLGTGVAEFVIAHVHQVPSGAIFFFVYSLVFTITAAILSYRFLETPFLKWKHKFEIVSSRPV